jgi:transcriptional regulator with XRE-family HTH domain
MKTGEMVKDARTAKGLTQLQLADKVGISQVQISRIEKGLNSPSIKTVKALAKALRIPVRDILITLI